MKKLRVRHEFTIRQLQKNSLTFSSQKYREINTLYAVFTKFFSESEFPFSHFEIFSKLSVKSTALNVCTFFQQWQLLCRSFAKFSSNQCLAKMQKMLFFTVVNFTKYSSSWTEYKTAWFCILLDQQCWCRS